MPSLSPKSRIPDFPLDISQQILNSSEPGTTNRCMYAISIRKQIPGAHNVDVDRHYMKFTAPGLDRDGTIKLMRYALPTPPVCIVHLEAFDRDKESMQPHKVVLRGSNNSAFAEPSVTRTFLLMPDGRVVKRKPRKKHGVEVKAKKRKQSAVRVRNCKRRYSPDQSSMGVLVVASQPTRRKRA